MRDYLFFGSLGLLYIFVVIMVTLHSRCGHYIFVLWFLLLLSFYFFLVCSQPSQIGCLPYFHTWCGLSANVGCRSETYCMRLAENTGRKRLPKIRDLRTIAQLCWAISLQQCTYQQSEKNLLNSNISPTHPEIGWDRFLVWGTPANFNEFRVLAVLLHGTLVVGVSQTLRRWTECAMYILQGDHHVWHWPTF